MELCSVQGKEGQIPQISRGRGATAIFSHGPGPILRSKFCAKKTVSRSKLFSPEDKLCAVLSYVVQTPLRSLEKLLTMMVQSLT